MDDLSKKQLELVRNATPDQKAQIATQNAIIRHQLKNPPVELPIDPDAKEELKSKDAKPGKGGKKSRRAKSKKSKKSKRRTTRRRGGTKGKAAAPGFSNAVGSQPQDVHKEPMHLRPRGPNPPAPIKNLPSGMPANQGQGKK